MASRQRKVSKINPIFDLIIYTFTASLLHQMQVPAWYIGPELQVLSRNIKQEEIPVFVTRVMAEIPDYVQKVAVF